MNTPPAEVKRIPAGSSPGVLLAGFEPFDGERLNPSWEAVRRLAGRTIAGRRIAALRLPTAFAASRQTLLRALARSQPALVIVAGQASGRQRLSLERVAINVIDARIADNHGKQPIDRPVRRGAPPAYFSTLPLKALLVALGRAGIPAEISNSAGTYVCNAAFYELMHALASRTSVRGGFVHLPYLPAQAVAHRGAPSMALETAVAGLELVIEVSLKTRRDMKFAAGVEA